MAFFCGGRLSGGHRSGQAVCHSSRVHLRPGALAPSRAGGWLSPTQNLGRAILDLLALALGVAAIAIPAAAILLAQGAGRDAFDDIFLYGRALATDTLPDPNAPWAANSLDHRQCRSRRSASLAVWNDRLPGLVGNGELAALAGIGSVAGVPAGRPGNDGRATADRGLGDRGLGPGNASRPLLAALLSSADRGRRDRGGCLLRRARLPL